MGLFGKKADCYGCRGCQAVCRENAIIIKTDEEGFYYPVILEDRCIGCGRCRKFCEEIHRIEEKEGEFYAVRCREEVLLRKSTSGGHSLL